MSSVTRLLLAVAVVLVAAGPGFAADEPSRPAPAQDPELIAARSRLEARDWGGAATLLHRVVVRDPRNADAHNLLAYSIRKGDSPDMALVFKHYTEALRLDPRHRGAHEYIGEAYLMVGDLPRARQHLAALDKLCFFPCSEYRDLKRAIEEYEPKARK